MKTNIHEYYLEQLRKGNNVHIKIKRVIKNYKGYDIEEFDWIIDDKFVLHDMPSEVFEEKYANEESIIKCAYCLKSFENSGVSCTCGRLCCSSKCDVESHKKYKCSSHNLK